MPQKSEERELIPLFEFVQESNRIEVRKLSAESPSAEDRMYDDDLPTEKTERWTYYVDLTNATDSSLQVEYLQNQQWLQFELNPNEFITLGAEAQEIHVRLCDCQYEAAADAGWTVTAVKAGYARYTYEFYTNRKRKVGLRGH